MRFVQGGSSYDQLRLICKAIGTPDFDSLSLQFSPHVRNVLRSVPQYPGHEMEQICPAACPVAIDLLRRMLQFDPKHRITVQDALNHPFFSEFRDPAMEFTCPTPFNSDFEEVLDRELTRERLSDMFLREMIDLQRERSEQESAATPAEPESATSAVH